MSRPLWTGSLNFGLVNIAVDLVMAVHEKTVHFHMLSKDGSCRLRRKLYCPETGKEYDFSETARGIEVGPDEYVVIEQREINRLRPEKGRAMEIAQFIDAAELDPVFFDRVYYLKPAGDSAKAYKLLLEAMIRQNKWAIARYVMRKREYLSAIRPTPDGMVLHTLNYADEVMPVAQILGPEMARIKVSAAELNMAAQLMKSLAAPLKMSELKDEYRLQLQKLVDAKIKGKAPATLAPEPDRAPPPTINLMEALKKSLAAGNGRSNGNGHHRPAHRRSA